MLNNNSNLLREFKKYHKVIRFILTFLGTYVVFTVFYQLYLNYFSSKEYYPDFITHLVALQSEALITTFGYESRVVASTYFPSMDLYVNGHLVASVIEGCNAVSVIVLFVAFMLAFFGKLKTTLLYILAGMAIIYAMNVVRIAILSIGIYELPQYAHFLHEIVFPLIIYGTVFVLWIFWIRIYTKQAGK